MAGVVAALVAVAGGIQAFRGPASTGVLHDRQARRRYGVTVGVEFGLAGVGAAVLAAAGQGDFIPVWVCAVVGVHFFALARLLEDPLLVPLGASVTAVALVALVAGLATRRRSEHGHRRRGGHAAHRVRPGCPGRHARGGDTAAQFARSTGVTSAAAIARTASNRPGRVAS